MRSMLSLSAAVASLLFAAPVLATETEAPAPRARPEGRAHERHERMSRRFDRAVEQGRLTRAQADQFKAEAQKLREEAQALRQASGGPLTPEQRAQLHERRRALREKVRAAMQAAPARGS